MVIQTRPIRVDRDLEVDRTQVALPDDPIIKFPERIRVGETVTLEIANYSPNVNYQVGFNAGEWEYDGGKFIKYTAPLVKGRVIMQVWTGYAPFLGFAVFRDGTVVFDGGEVTRVGGGDEFYVGTVKVNYAEAMEAAVDHNPPLPPLPIRPESNDDNIEVPFNPSSLFGTRVGSRLVGTKSKPTDPLNDYFLPSDEDTSPDALPFLYEVKDGIWNSRARNSNISEDTGNVYNGYRTPGAVGGSLTVLRNAPQIEKTIEIEFDIGLWDLEAALPDEILSLCLTTLEIQPVLRGIETGHTFEWEQVSGDQSQVFWITPKNQKDMQINIGDLKVDRVFKFYISRGTEYEKEYTLVLYGTPLSNINSSPNHPKPFGVMDNHLNIQVHDTKPILLDHMRIWHKKLRINIVRNY
jgi:hypothetical protein